MLYLPRTQKPQLGVGLDLDNKLNDGNVLEFAFNEVGGDRVHDLSGHGNNGTFSGDVSWVLGKDSMALDFPGTDDYIEVAENPSLNVQYISIGGWFYQHTRSGRFIDMYYTPYAYTLGSRAGGGEDEFGAWMYIAGHRTVAEGVQSSLNEWVFLVATYDGAVMRLYKNGVEVGTTARIGTIQSGAGNELVIGARSVTHTEDFNGLMENIFIYNHAITADQVWQLYINNWQRYQPHLIPYVAVAAGVASPTGVIYGPLLGPLGGPI